MHADSTVPATASDINEISENNYKITNSEEFDVCDEPEVTLIFLFI